MTKVTSTDLEIGAVNLALCPELLFNVSIIDFLMMFYKIISYLFSLLIFLLIFGLTANLWCLAVISNWRTADCSGVIFYFRIIFSLDITILILLGFDSWLNIGLGQVTATYITFLGRSELLCKIGRYNTVVLYYSL